MKTILKVYGSAVSVKEAMKRDAAEASKSGKDFRLRAMEGILEVTNICKVFYKVANGQCDHLRGFTVDEIYFDDLVNTHDRFGIRGIVKIRKSEEILKESEEFYYVVEDKVGSVTRTVRTNDKSFVEVLFREK